MTKTQMKNITKALLRGACVAAFVLAVTPGTAQAQFIDFQVVEGVVPGTSANTFTADLLNGGYSANLTLNNTSGTAAPNDGNGGGTWSETATATFSQYRLDGAALSGPFIGDAETNGYVILGTLVASGTYTEQANCVGTFECINFDFTSQLGTLGIDSDQNGTVDIPLITANGVGAGTFGNIVFSGGITGGAGNFIANFLAAHLMPGLADDYWPTLGSLSFTTTISGDINQLSLPNVEGDVSVQFTERQVPEPATLTLLGLGLAGVAGVARRRRAAKK